MEKLFPPPPDIGRHHGTGAMPAICRSACGRRRAAAYRRTLGHVQPVRGHRRSRVVAAAKMAVEDFLAGPHKMKRQIEVWAAIT